MHRSSRPEYSSAAWFDGWNPPLRPTEAVHRALLATPRPTARARTWLLSTGWRRWGSLVVDDVPG